MTSRGRVLRKGRRDSNMGDSFHEQLTEDGAFLRAERRLDTELVDKIILQLNRIYPQMLSDKEATKFRKLDVPTRVRLGELLTHLQAKGEEACREFYRALHLHVEDVYYSLPTRLRLRGLPLILLPSCSSQANSVDPITFPSAYKERHVMNDKGKRNTMNECSLGNGGSHYLL
ncbi:caspase recruitment domain family, member 19 isoform X4 [Phyllopteryx taeniolatus]|uniref:caspase recruitment domain family, member 19 isoform X4 n=1 Tax=Phyllopteryx taeniolatus TaxID=161469 RepID=UPI002AD3976E|nr:caspase recruitment domain family, member 19 isoform X4 [Phyllopteryx taeniolatus]